MGRRAMVGIVFGVLFAGCGQASDETGPAGSGVERVPLKPTETSTNTDDPWVAAVRAAKHPMAVAYGFPDDRVVASNMLYRSWERKKARCLQGLGFDYRPEVDDDPTAPQYNSDANAREPIERRKEFIAAYETCSDEASRLTYLNDALGVVDDMLPPTGSTVLHTEEEGRQAVIDYILANRDVIEELVANLEVD